MAFPYDDPTENEPTVDKIAANTNECKDKEEANKSDQSEKMDEKGASKRRRGDIIISMNIVDRTQDEPNTPYGCCLIFLSFVLLVIGIIVCVCVEEWF